MKSVKCPMQVISSFIRQRGASYYGVMRIKDKKRGTFEKQQKLFATNIDDAELELKVLVRDTCPGNGISAIDYALKYHQGRAKRKSIEPSTLRGYLDDVRAWTRYIGNVPISKLTSSMVEDALDAMFDDGCAATTVNRRYSQLQAACKDAIRRRILKENPFSTIDRPKGPSWSRNAVVGHERERMRDDILSMQPCGLKVAASLALFAGLRNCEVCGTQAIDINMNERTGWVRRSVGHGVNGWYIKTPKSNNARDYPISDYLMLVLEEWGMDGKWLIGRDDYAKPGWITEQWRYFARQQGYMGLEGKCPTFHDLRHTFATAAVAAGIDIRTLQSILGHADASITLKIYASADPSAKRQAGKLIDSYF